MNQSIYTEYANLTPDHVAWLDGCGAKWGSGDRLSELKSYTRVEFMCVDDTWYFMSTHNNSFTHIPTGSEFCERVAEILGIEKPMFASDLKDKLDKLVKKLEMHDRMERPLPEVEDKLLNDAFFNNDSSNIMSPEEVDAIIQSIATQPSHPHKTYHVLDSLDGIPFDTRIPLSEWIPPFKKEVVFIIDETFFKAYIYNIAEGVICLGGVYSGQWETIKELDGHWMRIV